MSPKASDIKIDSDKIIVYQMMFHLWGNTNENPIKNGSLEENGVTKFSDVSNKALQVLKEKGYTHLYMTGLIEHATMEDFTDLGIPLDNPQVIKGRCGSPFAIKDYYDVNSFETSKSNILNIENDFNLIVKKFLSDVDELIV